MWESISIKPNHRLWELSLSFKFTSSQVLFLSGINISYVILVS